MKLRIGRIPYANLFPIFHVLERDRDCSAYEFVEDVPSQLNRMLRKGAVDVGPSSSIEYLREPALYNVIRGHSISSSGPIGSIFLFSGRPIEELDGAEIPVTSQSETSVGLLDVILKKFYGFNCALTASDRPEGCERPFLLIGDDALKYKKGPGSRVMGHGIKNEGRPTVGGSPATRGKGGSDLDPGPLTLDPGSCPYVYDLGEIWFERTGLPFVFALWISRKDCREKGLLERLERDLDAARDKAVTEFPAIADRSPMTSYMTRDEIVQYWRKIEYGLDERHKQGLELFRSLLVECGALR